MTLRRSHPCARCGARIDPGDVYAAVDVLDAEGDLGVLLCPGCGRDLRDFLGGRSERTDRRTGEADE